MLSRPINCTIAYILCIKTDEMVRSFEDYDWELGRMIECIVGTTKEVPTDFK